MLNGFTEETKPLTDYEKDTLLPIMIQGLMDKQGKQKAVKNWWICKCLQSKGYKITEARVRKLINHIRVSGMVIGLIATSEGYYIADSIDEVDSYISSLHGREDAIKSVRVSLERQRDIMYGKGVGR